MAQNRKMKEKETATPVDANGHGPSEEQIALLAYQYWLARGCSHGAADEDWFRAEAKLKSQGSEGQSQTKFAASA